jgi:hypothetical protein
MSENFNEFMEKWAARPLFEAYGDMNRTHLYF